MTAEQALLQEHKKDPRVRYITQDNDKEVCFWKEMPSKVQGIWGSIEVCSYPEMGVEIEFLNSDIICIDDIKQIPPIGKQWYIECTEDNRDILNGWRLENATDCLDYELCVGFIILSKNIKDDSLFFADDINRFKKKEYYKDYQEITLEQFKKYVLCEGKKNQEEKTIGNHPIMSIAELERQQLQEEEQLPKFLQEINKAVSDLLTPFESRKTWIEKRIKSINKGIEIYIEQLYCIPIEWVEERNELIEKLKNL